MLDPVVEKIALPAQSTQFSWAVYAGATFDTGTRDFTSGTTACNVATTLGYDWSDAVSSSLYLGVERSDGVDTWAWSPSVGFATYCDPYWYVCYPTAVSIDRIIGDRSATDFGINFGAGVTFGAEAKFFVEARYHYVWGDDIPEATPISTNSAGNDNANTSASYFPLIFGVRW